jgi:hypothetical protein
LLDAPGYAVAMLRAHGVESLQDHEVEGALEDVRLVGRHVLQLLWDDYRRLPLFVWDVNRKIVARGWASWPD